jgi:hypothetical protein
VTWYLILQKAVRLAVPSSQEARELLHASVRRQRGLVFWVARPPTRTAHSQAVRHCWSWVIAYLAGLAWCTTARLPQVPAVVYTYSEAAFLVATVLNTLNLVFEDTAEKQQLAMLSAIIKGVSWHSDHLITSGAAVVKLDYHGVL